MYGRMMDRFRGYGLGSDDLVPPHHQTMVLDVGGGGGFVGNAVLIGGEPGFRVSGVVGMKGLGPLAVGLDPGRCDSETPIVPH